MKGVSEDGGVFKVIRTVIRVSAVIAGIAVLVMIGVTVTDVVLRLFKKGITGAYDIVRICGLISIACGLPYLTAVKGHIAIEFFYQRFSRIGRVILDSFFRAIAFALFGFLAYRCVTYGLALKASGQVMLTLRVPVFWMPFLISFDCVLMVIIILYHMLHPGKEMIKP